MLRALCLATTILVFHASPAAADSPPDPGANAALKYWQAFATLPKLTDAESQKLIAEYLTMPLDAHAREIVTNAEYALEMMHHGAKLTSCDWGIDSGEGIYARTPHGPASRVLSSLACLRARMRFEEGRTAGAIDDIVAGMTMGRHVSQDGLLILLFVGHNIEHRMSETLAHDLPKLNSELIKDLKTRLDALPPGGTPARAMRMEEKFGLDWFIRIVKETKDKEKLLAILGPLFMSDGERRPSPERARAFLEECGGTSDGMLKFAEEVRPSYAIMAKKLDLPPDQFDQEFDREEKRQSRNPVFKLFFPALRRVRWQQARAEVRRALLSTALAVQVEGRDALKNHPDPVVGGPFEYVAVEGGFQLRSKLKGQDDKPLTLTVGRRGR